MFSQFSPCDDPLQKITDQACLNTFDPVDLVCLMSETANKPEKIMAFLNKKNSEDKTFVEVLLYNNKNGIALQEFFRLLTTLHLEGISIDKLVDVLKVENIKRKLPLFPEYVINAFIQCLNYALYNQNNAGSLTMPIKI